MSNFDKYSNMHDLKEILQQDSNKVLVKLGLLEELGFVDGKDFFRVYTPTSVFVDENGEEQAVSVASRNFESLDTVIDEIKEEISRLESDGFKMVIYSDLIINITETGMTGKIRYNAVANGWRPSAIHSNKANGTVVHMKMYEFENVWDMETHPIFKAFSVTLDFKDIAKAYRTLSFVYRTEIDRNGKINKTLHGGDLRV